MSDLGDLRREYHHDGLSRAQLSSDPFEQFATWFAAVQATDLPDPNAMVLATYSPATGPSQRTVLLKYFGPEGFVFFTNLGSRKAQQIDETGKVSLLFPWNTLERQVEVSGTAVRISAAEVLAYFSRRPRGSQLGAWVSHQSAVIDSRGLLKAKLAQLVERFRGGDVPVPTFWGGFRIEPTRLEFWQGQPDRLHDRFQYRKSGAEWILERLSP